eukprot:2609533-Amphidinium_carterae.1
MVYEESVADLLNVDIGGGMGGSIYEAPDMKISFYDVVTGMDKAPAAIDIEGNAVIGEGAGMAFQEVQVDAGLNIDEGENVAIHETKRASDTNICDIGPNVFASVITSASQSPNDRSESSLMTSDCYPSLFWGGGELGDAGQKALRALRSKPELAGLADSKVMRTLRLATPKLAERLNEWMRSAGLASMLHTEQEGSDSTQPAGRGRWGRRSRTDANADAGWTLVQTKRDGDTLCDEWTVPVTSGLRMNQSGVAYTDEEDVAKQWLDITRNNPHPCAIVSRKRLQLGLPDVSVSRVAFHMDKTVMRGGLSEHANSTNVLRIIAHEMYTPKPKDVWKLLEHGKTQVFKDALVCVLASHANEVPSSMIVDVFKLQKLGKTISGCVRVQSEAAVECLRPLGELSSTYPVIWDTYQLPPSLEAYRERCTDLDAVGLAIDEKRLGFRVHTDEETYLRGVLSKPKLFTWRLGGLPLTCSYHDAVTMLADDFQFTGEVVEASRQVWRGRQSWLVKSVDEGAPVEDTIKLVVEGDDDENADEEAMTHFVTLKLVEQRGNDRVKQWRGRAKSSDAKSGT